MLSVIRTGRFSREPPVTGRAYTVPLGAKQALSVRSHPPTARLRGLRVAALYDM